ncbi:DUF4197 domain-containing protein [Ohtaekwangia koreensis]|jgi:hypothetical protein|uniref:DUF4197 domain-containing protein n=1 Tax=Ohtaekwangia koreensis TaxID=688867 RepID=A0A1T5IRI1_9BACT|nr:DUF4197 domain-containing protein [Ohtaekwangia koreensis]SKC41751.1 Protein of unknown function [Ohtaekwangia koreensis]
MKKQIILLLSLVLLCKIGTAQISLDKLKKAVKGESALSTEEVAEGLKEALTKGASKGSDLVSKADGYFKNAEIKIPFPPEVQKVETKLRQMGMGAEVDKFVLALNRGAEDAAKEAKPIFVSAIKQMTIQDAWSILKGEDDAATQYLKRTTTSNLTEKFKPVIQASLEKTNATKYYKDLVTRYNKIPLVQKVNPNLDDYATEKAISGLFVMVAKEEKSIRDDPGSRTTELLKKVFSAQ